MKTIVVQAWTGDRPSFIDRCLETVSAWAECQGFDYGFETDALLREVPDSYRRHVSGLTMPMTNFGRLLLLRDRLRTGYDRAIWCDADVVIFDRERLHLRDVRDYALTREVWTGIDATGAVRHSVNVTGCLMVFERANSFLDFALHALARRAERTLITEPRGSFTRMLTDLDDIVPLQTVTEVGMLSPLLLDEIVRGAPTHLSGYMKTVGSRLCGVNLSAAFHNLEHEGVLVTDAVYAAVIDRCLATRGAIFNRYVSGGSKVEVAEPHRPERLAQLLPGVEDGLAQRLG